MEIKTYIILSISMVIIVGLSYGYVFREDNIELENVDWCVPGNNITISNQEIGEDITTEEGQVFEIKGNATYNGKEVCRAEYISEEGTLVQYFTKNKDFIKFVYKNSSENVTNEIELNSTSFENNYDDIVYDDTTYDNINYDNINYDNIDYHNINYANIYGENINVEEITKGE